jgi:hypothetical protein
VTLHHLRILHLIYGRSGFGGQTTRHGEICRDLFTWSSTVSRAIATLLDMSLIREQPDPADRRRRQIIGTVAISTREGLNSRFSQLLDRIHRDRLDGSATDRSDSNDQRPASSLTYPSN